MREYKEDKKALNDAVIEAYGKVTENFIGISNSYSCCNHHQIISDIQKSVEENNNFYCCSDLSEILSDYPKARELVLEYFQGKLPLGEIIN